VQSVLCILFKNSCVKVVISIAGHDFDSELRGGSAYKLHSRFSWRLILCTHKCYVDGNTVFVDCYHLSAVHYTSHVPVYITVSFPPHLPALLSAFSRVLYKECF